MKTVLIFDVNETLLQVSAMRPQFEKLFGDDRALPLWFAQLLQAAFVCTLTGAYQDFGICGRNALQIVAQRYGLQIDDSEQEALLAGFLELPAHPEVPESLERLRAAGFRLATLTNSAPNALAAQLQNAGLSGYFEKTISVDAVQKFKPDPAPYHAAAAAMGVPIDQVRMIAAHNWDTTGAIRAGCRAAFIARPGAFLGPLDERPDIIGEDLAAVVQQIVESDQAL